MKAFKLFALLCSFTTLLSCSQDYDFFYPETKNGMNIWLGSGTVVDDSVTYNFAYTVPGKDSIMFNYRLSGYPLDHDVEFQLEAVSGDTQLVHYEFGKYLLKAGAYAGRFPIYITKPQHYNEFASSTGRIVFRLKSTTALEQGVKERSELKVLFRNFVSKPDNWDAATYPYYALSRYFGTYSNVKYSFVIQTTGMANFKVYYTVANNPILEDNTITATKATYFQNLCKVALQNYETQNGPLFDENNNRVVFP